uniref:Uncharacterized protein n=1 Tax=Calcidiscus leptoporus TaxID=127549 RepID=A0A7S0NSE3_9EUKA|mmetsp:Transcript_18379/g.42089  ORF Transcript_18379/g.42089 Transcript_18379/m.42089 type:complete len:435 (+) Transcript_18379:58-1362(+)
MCISLRFRNRMRNWPQRLHTCPSLLTRAHALTPSHSFFCAPHTLLSLKEHGERVSELEIEIDTKSTHADIAELREWLQNVPLRDESREMVERVRTESSSRIRMLKERLDHTDRELLRQLEESHALDTAERYEALTALIEQKADRDTTDRWLEASSALHSELQTLHVRTQTLGQGMKVVLGWVEGMADKVTGLQGSQIKMATEVKGMRTEQKQQGEAVAFKTQAMEGQVRSLLEHIETQQVSTQGTPHMPPFAAGSPRGRSQGLDVVVLKQGAAGTLPAPPVRTTSANSVGRSSGTPRGNGGGGRPQSALQLSSQELEGWAVPEAEQAELGAATLADGVCGDEIHHILPVVDSTPSGRQRSVPTQVGLALPGADVSALARPLSSSYKSDAERRKQQLDAKRKILIESRLRQPAPPTASATAAAAPSPRAQGGAGV